MTYQQTLDYLYALQPPFHLVGASAYKPGLDNMLALMRHLSDPHRAFSSVHIAGTNGKGSTSHLIAATLQTLGMKVGLYTSPHLVDFRERIRINGTMIPRDYVVSFVDSHRSFLENLRPSFFETATALAFDWFAHEGVDIAVVETGLGGRLDATNILEPSSSDLSGVKLTVITNIAFDHTALLGNTLQKIAFEKAGIMKPGAPCVIGEADDDVLPVFIERAEQCGIYAGGFETSSCRLWVADNMEYLRRLRHRFVTDCQLKGSYQEHNMQTAFVALRALKNCMPDNAFLRRLDCNVIASAFARVASLTGLRGRWETLSDSPLTICDTGHNSHGIRYVADQLRNLLSAQRHKFGSDVSLRMVFGMVEDKDIDVVLSLLPVDAVYYFTTAATHRAVPASQMMSRWLDAHNDIREKLSLACRSFPDVRSALHSALLDARTTPNDIVFIGGSNYVVGEALAYLDAQ